MGEASQTFKILLIASEILIPVIVLIGAYFIFKPMIKKNKELLDEKNKKSTLDKNED